MFATGEHRRGATVAKEHKKNLHTNLSGRSKNKKRKKSDASLLNGSVSKGERLHEKSSIESCDGKTFRHFPWSEMYITPRKVVDHDQDRKL